MCVSHDQGKRSPSRLGKSATKGSPRREPSAGKHRKTGVTTSKSSQAHQLIKSSNQKKHGVAETSLTGSYSSKSTHINASSKDTATRRIDMLSLCMASEPLPEVSASHEGKRKTYNCPVHPNCNRKHRNIVRHDYHDHASDLNVDAFASGDNLDDVYFDDEFDQPLSRNVTKTRKNTRESTQSETFPYRLYRMIEDAYAKGDDGIIHFMPHGRAIRVEDHDGLVDKILPRYFQQSKYVSFQRQLLIYGFKKLTTGPDQGMCIVA